MTLRIEGATNNVFLPDHNLILFCVTKSANTSIKRAVLDALAEIRDPWVKDRWAPGQEPRGTHRHPGLHRTPLPEILKDPRTARCFKAVLVRNPFDRLVSCYTEKVLGDKGLRNMDVRPDMPFEEFVDRVCETPDEQSDIHIESQHRFFVYKGKILVDFLGSVENIRADWDVVRAQTRLNLARLGHDNRSPKRTKYQSYYTRELIRKVEYRYARDLELLGYGFDRAPSQTLPRFEASPTRALSLLARTPRAVALKFTKERLKGRVLGLAPKRSQPPASSAPSISSRGARDLSKNGSSRPAAAAEE